MFFNIKQKLLEKRMRQLISVSVERMYSEQFDYEGLVSMLSEKKGGVDQLRPYIAICVAMGLTQPLRDSDVKGAVERTQMAERHLGKPEFDEIVVAYGQLSDLLWNTKHMDIMRRKWAFKQDENSFDGLIYSGEHETRGPLSVELRESARITAEKIKPLQKRIDEIREKEWQESDPKEYEEYLQQKEIDRLDTEIHTLETKRIQNECMELSIALEEKIDHLLTAD